MPVCAVAHAGRGRFCAAVYQRQRKKWARQGEFQLVKPEQLPSLVEGTAIFCGELDDEARQTVEEALGDEAIIASPARSMRRAAVLAEMAWERISSGQGDDLALLSPIYLHTA